MLQVEKCRLELGRAKKKQESDMRMASEILELENNKSRLEEKLKNSEIELGQLTTRLEHEQALTAQLRMKIKEFQARIGELEKFIRNSSEDSKSDSIKNETTKLIYDDVPDIFNDIKNVPSVFTVNSFNFTASDTNVKNCECIVDKNAIRKNSKFTL